MLPTYSFNENYTTKVLLNGNPWFDKVQRAHLAITRIPIVIMYGWGPLPFQVPVTVVGAFFKCFY